MCAQRCVSVGRLPWSRMGYFLVLAQEGVNDAKKVESELKEDKEHISVPTCKSATFTFMSCYKHPTSSFFLATRHRPTLELALHLLDRLNAPLLQTPENTPFSTMSSLLQTRSVAHTPKTRSPVHNGSIAESSSLKSATTAKTGQRAAPSHATEANSRERRAG